MEEVKVGKEGKWKQHWESRNMERQEFHILTSFYLAEYDVDYTANHHQGIEDIPGVPDIALNMAPCTPSRRRGGGRRGRGCRKV